MATTTTSAALVGGLVMWWLVGGFALLIGTAVDEPWGTWEGVFDSARRGFPCTGIALLPVLVMMAIALLSLRDRQVRVVLLSPVCFLLPGTIWLVCAAMRLNADVMADDRLDPIADFWLVQFVGSCFWLPVGVACWGAVVIYGLSRLTSDMQGCCPQCGYDLRGSVAGEGASCPECGKTISEDLRQSHSPPSI